MTTVVYLLAAVCLDQFHLFDLKVVFLNEAVLGNGGAAAM